jgi:hypothetical protein
VGSITFGITLIAGVAAFSARETCRVRMEDLGNKHAVPLDRSEYERLRAQTKLERART